MMEKARIGVSPTRRKKTDYRPARVTVAVLTFIPELEGYHRHRLDVLKLCMGSILSNTEKPYDLMVFDNGSCQPVIEYLSDLRDQGAIDLLMLSARNLGKIGALEVMFNAAPGDLIVYADDDILFYPGWMPAHLAIFDHYPNPGMVSGLPVRNDSQRSTSTVQSWMMDNPEGLVVSEERRIPDEWEADWAVSTGRDPQEHLDATKDQKDMILNYRSVEAFGSANHFQYLASKEALVKAMPGEWTGKLMGHMRELDEAIDQQGLLRLSTLGRYTRHIGNVILPELAEEVKGMGLEIGATPQQTRKKKHWLLIIPGMGRLLRKVYGWLFDILHGLK